MSRQHNESCATIVALAERLQAWFGGHFASKDARLHDRLGV